MTGKLDPSSAPRQGSSPPTDRVLSVLELLGRAPTTQFSVAEICRRLDISRATAHAILTTLAAREWATRDPATGRYAWGPAVAALARPTDAQLHRTDLHALAHATGTHVSLARREGATLVVIDTVGEHLRGPRISAGMRTPFVAPIGRDHAAWSSAEVREQWLRAIGTPSREFRARMNAVLAEIRQRGFVVERLTHEYVRVYTALRALSADGEVDEITTQLAGAYANLAIIDILDDELARDAAYSVATISAPVRGADGSVALVVMASPFATLTGSAIRTLGQRVRGAAHSIEQRIARYGEEAAR
ncbi:MarR family transcriptional regulator [Mycolicibacterium moriokaense]|nr:MarR family transcriptional regulator [Mycolicibacterium moriokaense]